MRHSEKNAYCNCSKIDREVQNLIKRIETLQREKDKNIRLITEEIQYSLSIFRRLITSLKRIELNKCNQTHENSRSITLILQKWELSYIKATASAVMSGTDGSNQYISELKETYFNEQLQETSHRQ